MKVRVFDLKMQVEKTDKGIHRVSLILLLDGKPVKDQKKRMEDFIDLAKLELELDALLGVVKT